MVFPGVTKKIFQGGPNVVKFHFNQSKVRKPFLVENLIAKCQVCTFHDGFKQGIDQQIFNRKSISRKITHPNS